MTGPVLFFADVHLSVEDPAKSDLFRRFLAEVAVRAERVVCLGDLFDVWLGAHQAKLPDFAGTLDALGRVAGAGVPVDFVHGNRDFLAGSEFQRLSIGVHTDGIDLELGGTRVHGCHGDLLCTGDRRYQAYRRVVRSAPVRALVGAVPFGVSWRVARGMRAASRREVAAKTREEMAISRSALALLVARGKDVVVCGHVHRASDFEVAGGGRTGRVLTLGDWREVGPYLWYESGDFGFREFR